MKKLFVLAILSFAFTLSLKAQICVNCHKGVTPKIVSDWQLSKHAQNDVDCTTCHGDDHNNGSNVSKVILPTPETCNQCHETQVSQYKKGKHAVAWTAMKAMPTAHMQPMALMEGLKGCGGCHKIGDKTTEELKQLKESGSVFGHFACESCHTRHTFNADEARQPEACKTCHQGFDHPQWEMYSTAKHGVRNTLKQIGVLGKDSAAPTCQTCHMSKGDHEVRTAWGFLAVRLPMPKDEQWAKDRATILKALGVLDINGNPTKLVDVVKAADVARLTEEDWQKERSKMIKICGDCHSENMVKAELQKGDEMIRQADKLMAEAISTVADLYKDGLLKKPDSYPQNYPLLLAFHDAPTSIEQKLFVMFLEHRMRTFQGTFHINPDYAFWYGWSEMVRDLTEIKEKAAEMRTAKH
jgi:hypothetical protein